jgi:hypothetical protein
MATPEQLQTWLDEAIAARHALFIGESTVTVRDPTGRMVQYTAARRKDLYEYIAWLQGQLDPTTYPPRKRTYRVTQMGTGL